MKKICDDVLGNVLKQRNIYDRMRTIMKEGREEEFAKRVMGIMKTNLYDHIINKIKAFCSAKGPLTLKELQEQFPESVKPFERTFYTDLVTSQHFSTWWTANQMDTFK